MYWVIRWTNPQTGEDHSAVVEATSRVVAETIALKRDIPVVFIGEAGGDDVRAAREAKMLWGAAQPAGRTAFGCPVAMRQIACLMLCGVWTIGVLLQASGVLPPLMRLHF
jgi:hypothetical protein